ncbi:MAG: ABC-2 family transporter protein [Anaerolineae bacterium]|nr:ABC-2 family transporter protein [Thermoflexales bacterium]MDW8395243.1 ABC-2 family transporter protein [Anaerolineae bacterium]
MARYARLFWRFASGNVMSALEYRVGFATALAMSLIDVLWAVGGALVFYSHRPTLGGWTFDETLIVIGLFFIASGFVDAFLQPSLRELIELVRTGTMDYVLLRPMDAMIHATLRRQRIEKLSSVGVGVALIVLAAWRLPLRVDALGVLIFIMLSGAALMLLYALVALLMAACFWVVDLTNIEELLLGTLETARYPVQAFPEPMRSILSLVIPIAFVSTVPAEALLGRLRVEAALYGVVFALMLLGASRLAWREALRRYTSASS